MTELEPLDDDILALVQGAKEVPELDPASRTAIFAVTSAKIEAGGGGGGGDGGGGSSGAGAGAGAGALGKITVAVALFVAGVAAGVAVDRALLADVGHAATTPAVVVAPRASAAAASGVAALEAVSATSLPDAPRAAPALSPSASAVVSRSGASADAPSSRGLAAERALLDVARSALARGEAGEALAATERHAREYPDGSLVEEREALAVKALVALGRTDEARRRAHALEQRFPNGLTVRAVRAAVGETP